MKEKEEQKNRTVGKKRELKLKKKKKTLIS